MSRQPLRPSTILKRLGLLTIAAIIGVILARLLSKTVEPDDAIEPDDGPTRVTFRINERRYPPFSNSAIQPARIEGEFDAGGARQIVVLGVPVKKMKLSGTLAIARCDARGLWHPAVLENPAQKGYAIIRGNDDKADEVAAVALYAEPGELCVTLGTIKDGHFTPYSQTHVIAMTAFDGLTYDYPTVPLAKIAQ